MQLVASAAHSYAQRNIPGNMECHRGDTVRGTVLRGLAGTAGMVTAGDELTASDSCVVLVCVLIRAFGVVGTSSPLVLAAEKAGPAVSANKNNKNDNFIS
jgi:hypothetical protein